MGLFKNKVGRPSNRIKKIRKLVYTLIIVLIITLVCGLSHFVLKINDNTEVFSSMELSKLNGSVTGINFTRIGKDIMYITYIDNLRGNKAFKDFPINVTEKFVYTGIDNLFYRLDLYKNNELKNTGMCREINSNDIASLTFDLVENGLNVVTNIYTDSDCNDRVLRYKTKTYYIGEDKPKDDSIVSQDPTMSVPKFKSKWKVGENSGLFNIITTNPTMQDVKLESSNPNIMEVIVKEGKFMLVAKNPGTVTITATSSEGLVTKYTYVVENYTKLTLSKESSSIKVGDKENITVIVTPNTQKVSAMNYDNSIIEVKQTDDTTWSITGKKAGTTTITFKTSDGIEKKLKYTVNATSNIAIENYTGTINMGKDVNIKLQLTLVPTIINASSSDTSVLGITKISNDKYVLSPKKAGTATITFKTTDYSKSFKYTVINNIEPEVTMQKFPDNLIVGKTYGKFKVGTNLKVDRVTVISSNPSVLQVMRYGDNTLENNSWGLAAHKPGEVTITAEVTIGAFKKTKTYKYTVIDEPSIQMPNIPNKLKVGKTSDIFSLNVIPITDTVALESSDKNIVEVVRHSENRYSLRAKKAGKVTLTASSKSGAKQTYEFIVEEEPKLIVSTFSNKMTVGDTISNITVTVTPSTDTIKFDSSNLSVVKVQETSKNMYKIEGVGIGNATLTVSTSSGLKQTYTISVTEKPKVELPTMDNELYVGTETKKFSLVVVPINDTVTLESSDRNIVEVIRHSENIYSLKGVKEGKATLTASSKSGAKQTYTFTVKGKPSISLINMVSTIEEKKSVSVKVNVVPSTDKVKLVSSNNNILMPSECNNGTCTLIAKKTGNVTITAVSESGAKKEYKVEVISANLETNLSLISENLNFEDAFEILTAESTSAVTVTSSDERIIKVSTIKENISWRLDLVGIGSSTITVTSNGKMKSKKFNVVAPSGKEMINTSLKTGTTLTVGSETSKFKVDYYPPGAYVMVESNDNSGLEVLKYGDNSNSKNSWSLKAKKKGTYKITVKTANDSKFSSVIQKVTYEYIVKEEDKKLETTLYFKANKDYCIATYGKESCNYSTSSKSYTLSYAYDGYKISASTVPSNTTVDIESSDTSVVNVKKVNNNSFQIRAINVSNKPVTVTLKASNGLKQVYTFNTSGTVYESAEDLFGRPNSEYYTENISGGTKLMYSKYCSTYSKNNFINMVKKLPDYVKKSSKVIYLVDYSTWSSLGWSNVAGWTITDPNPYILVPCDGDYTYNSSISNYAIYHEYGHVVDSRYDALSYDGKISYQEKYVFLKNNAYKYSKNNGGCNSSYTQQKCAILRGYAYTNEMEFFAESFMMTIRTQAGYRQTDLSSNWGRTDRVSFSPYKTIDDEMKKTLETVKTVIK